MNLVGATLPRPGAPGLFVGRTRFPVNDTPPAEIPLPVPSIESLPEYLGAIDPKTLSEGARHYNGSVAKVDGRIFMAYRFETYSARSRVGLCELALIGCGLEDGVYEVRRNVTLELEGDPRAHAEDPHMACVGGRLHLFFAHVVLGIPCVCRQRLVIIDPDTMGVVSEERVSIGDYHSIEKNWQPFEDERGRLSVVYQQNPRTIISVPEKALSQVNLPPMAPGKEQGPHDKPGAQRKVSGRTPPIRISDSEYLEFVGGHVPDFYRNSRYWFGAICFEAKAPYRVTRFTPQPLVWGSESSMTIHSPRPNAGHPICIFPSGVFLEGGNVVVSCGVNDSFICLLRYNMEALLKGMMQIPA